MELLLYPGIWIATYILLAMGMYTIARRRGIQKPWLAWIPVANMWLLGCISDQYRYVARNQEKARRKLMVALAIISAIAVAILFAALVAMFISIAEQIGITWELLMQWAELSEEALELEIEGLLTERLENNVALFRSMTTISLVVDAASLVCCAASIWLVVLQFMAYYDLYMSTNPNNATAFLLLSIFIGGFVTALLVFLSRDKDEGMPLRQQVVEQES